MTHFWTNYHSHSHYCDGVLTPEDQVKGALEQDVKIFGFSSHCPVPFENAWSMKSEKLKEYLDETRLLKENYAGKIELYQGLEIDYVPGVCTISEFSGQLDYSIGSVHYVDLNWNGEPWEIDGSTEGFLKGMVEVHDGDIRKVIERYYALIREMVQTDCPDIVGHLDKIKMHNLHETLFSESDQWYQEAVEATLETIARAECVVEINTRGLYKRDLDSYPSEWVLRRMFEMNIPVMINSDSHAPEEITARFSDAARRLRRAGYRFLRVFSDREWKDIPFGEEGLYFTK
jgi:histidinol-phosphatase (PHP family)